MTIYLASKVAIVSVRSLKALCIQHTNRITHLKSLPGYQEQPVMFVQNKEEIESRSGPKHPIPYWTSKA